MLCNQCIAFHSPITAIRHIIVVNFLPAKIRWWNVLARWSWCLKLFTSVLTLNTFKRYLNPFCFLFPSPWYFSLLQSVMYLPSALQFGLLCRRSAEFRNTVWNQNFRTESCFTELFLELRKKSEFSKKSAHGWKAGESSTMLAACCKHILQCFITRITQTNLRFQTVPRNLLNFESILKNFRHSEPYWTLKGNSADPYCYDQLDDLCNSCVLSCKQSLV